MWAVVPVKGLSGVKTRLGDVLSENERAQLCALMLEDVLAALKSCPSLEGVALITPASEVEAIADAYDVQIIKDDGRRDISGAAQQAADELIARGVDAMMLVPADVPFIDAADIENVIAQHGQTPAVTLTAASDDNGTNLLICAPPNVIPFRYGLESFLRHQEEAKQCGAHTTVVYAKSVARDIDRPEDLLAMAAAPTSCKAAAFVAELGVAQRIENRTALHNSK
jgi:2-phospho-L-lactate guanylyltransferase